MPWKLAILLRFWLIKSEDLVAESTLILHVPLGQAGRHI